MKLSEYIASVLTANSLQDIARYLLKTTDHTYYADSHVDDPPKNLGVQAACSAGLALLVEWTREAASLGLFGLVASKPILIVDQEWLVGLPDAPPPHVLVNLAKNDCVLPPAQLNATQVSHSECPIGCLLVGELEHVILFKIEASEERESLGGWVFQM